METFLHKMYNVTPHFVHHCVCTVYYYKGLKAFMFIKKFVQEITLCASY